jgi:L-histidine N-alpha-methyltransferase
VPRASAAAKNRQDRLHVDVLLHADRYADLARDVSLGLSQSPKELPPKYFYDDVGSRLFDLICDTPEYYQTRTEYSLLETCSERLIALAEPTDVVELGSGTARKTRVLLDALAAGRRACRYVPFDVSEGMLRHTAGALAREYPWLDIHAIAGDYDQHLSNIPGGERRLFLFLGGTIGNFDDTSAIRFLSTIRREMKRGDRLLLGLDLVKDHDLLHAAYNDADGITAAFNKNVLSVLNRELDADFDLDTFEHVAFFDARESQIEMHLRSLRDQTVTVAALDMKVKFRAGELMRTEISRKFTKLSADHLLRASGLVLDQWFTPDNGYFALALCAPRPTSSSVQ